MNWQKLKVRGLKWKTIKVCFVLFFFLERKTVKVRGSVLHVCLVFICKLIYNLCTCTIIKNNYNFTHIWVQIIPGVRIRHFLITFKTDLITFILENRFSLSLSQTISVSISQTVDPSFLSNPTQPLFLFPKFSTLGI